MEDLNRTFKLASVDEGGQLLNLIEGDAANGSPDGELELDGPAYTINSIRLLREPVKRIEIELLFESDQGSRTQQSSRFLTFNYADLPAGAKNKVKDFYNWVTDAVIKTLPELTDGVEQ